MDLKTSLAGGTFALACLVSVARAGTIASGTYTGDSDSGIDSSKTYTAKADFAGTGTVTVNGVSFTDTATTGTNYALTGNAGFGTASFSANKPSGVSTPNVSGNLNSLVDNFFYSPTVQTLTLSGLTVGDTYKTSFFNAAFGGAGGRYSTVSDSNGQSFLYDENVNGNGNPSLLTDTFTATANTFSITFTQNRTDFNTGDPNSTGTGDAEHEYGFTNELVSTPEPASIGLLAIAGAGLLARRRRA